MKTTELKEAIAKFLTENGTEKTAVLISDAIDFSHRPGDSIDYTHRAIGNHLLDIIKVGSVFNPAKSHAIKPVSR